MGDRIPLICSTESFVEFINSLLTSKNTNKFGRLIPWLPEYACASALDSFEKSLHQLNEDHEIVSRIIYTTNKINN